MSLDSNGSVTGLVSGVTTPSSNPMAVVIALKVEPGS